jgi:hypothetical protein
MSGIIDDSFDILPLDCLRLIALIDIPTYRAMLTIRRFALTTLGVNNVAYRVHFTIKTNVDGDGPRVIYYLNGMIHRDEDLPASIHYDGTQYWYQFGRWHRDNDKPACVSIDGDKVWYRRGLIHRDNDQPAVIRPDYHMEWWQHGKRHRDGNKPAIIWDDGTQEWYWHGEKHRGGGLPAVINSNGGYSGYLYGTHLPYCLVSCCLSRWILYPICYIWKIIDDKWGDK